MLLQLTKKFWLDWSKKKKLIFSIPNIDNHGEQTIETDRQTNTNTMEQMLLDAGYEPIVHDNGKIEWVLSKAKNDTFPYEHEAHKFGPVAHLVHTSCDKLKTYEQYTNAKNYSVWEVVYQHDQHKNLGTPKREWIEVDHPNVECEWCGCTGMEVHVGDEMCRECCLIDGVWEGGVGDEI